MIEEKKVGYKQTDIGIIPEDWNVKYLGDLANFYKGKFLPKSNISYSGKFKCIHYGELFTHYKEKIKDIRYKTNQPLNISFLSKSNDVLMPTSDVTPNGLAKASCVLEDNLILGGDILVIRMKEQAKLNGVFLSYFIRLHKDEIMKRISGTTVYHLYASDIKDLLVHFPEIEEQNSIVSALMDIDGLINSLEELIVKKRNMKKAAIQKLITGEKRIPGFCTKWEKSPLEDLANFYKGKFLPKSNISYSGKFKCIHYGELFTHYKEKIKDIRYKTNQPLNISFLSKSNDVLMPTSDVTPNGLAKASCVLEDNLILGGDILVIRMKEQAKLNGVFLSYFIRLHKDEIMKRISGTTVYHLYASDIKDLLVHFPEIEEQNSIVSILEDMSEEIEIIEHRLAKANSMKAGMMHDLLSGKTRLCQTNIQKEFAS